MDSKSCLKTFCLISTVNPNSHLHGTMSKYELTMVVCNRSFALSLYFPASSTFLQDIAYYAVTSREKTSFCQYMLYVNIL